MMCSLPKLPQCSIYSSNITSTPLFHGPQFILPFFYYLGFETFLFSLDLSVRVAVLWAPCSLYPFLPPHPHPTTHLSKFSIHCPPDSHPSTWVQFKKPFNSCHSKGLAISPAAKAQTGTLLQQATLNVSTPPPNPPFQMDWRWKTLFLKDRFSWRQVDSGGVLILYCYLPPDTAELTCSKKKLISF